MTSLLQKIHSGKRQQPPRILIYGSEGIGKSTFAASAPKPVFIPTEDGLDHIACDSFPLCTSFEQVIECLTALKNDEHDYKTVVIDSIDWLEQLIFDHLCREYNVKSIEKVDGGYGKGYVHALTFWRRIVDDLRFLRETRGMVVVLVAHTKIEAHSDPESSPFDRFSPKLHKKANSMICEWCDAILLATREYGAAKGDDSGGQRVLRCMSSPTCVAKNRYALPDVLPFNWAALVQAITKSI